jgi:hypothetical protein
LGNLVSGVVCSSPGYSISLFLSLKEERYNR